MENKKQSQSKKLERNNKLKSATNSFKTILLIMLVLSCIIDITVFALLSPIVGIICFIPIIIGFILMNIVCEYLYSISKIEVNSEKQVELLERILNEK